jgi:DNA polymerase-4
MNLFDKEQEKLDLYKAVDDIKNQFGSGAITKAISLKHRENPKKQ